MGPPNSLYVRIFGAHTANFLEDTVKTVKNCSSPVHHLRRVQSDLDRHSIVEY